LVIGWLVVGLLLPDLVVGYGTTRNATKLSFRQKRIRLGLGTVDGYRELPALEFDAT